MQSTAQTISAELKAKLQRGVSSSATMQENSMMASAITEIWSM